MFNKLRWFLFYRKVIRKNKELLLKKHDIKIDWVNRMYKTYTLSDDDVREIENYGTAYVNKILEKDKALLEETFLDLKIHQFVGLMELEQLNEKQIGVAFRYKHFDSAKIANRGIWFLFYLIMSALSYSIFSTEPKIIFSFLFGLIGTFVIYLITRLFTKSRIEK